MTPCALCGRDVWSGAVVCDGCSFVLQIEDALRPRADVACVNCFDDDMVTMAEPVATPVGPMCQMCHTDALVGVSDEEE